MTKALLGTIAGLLLGMAGALAYSHYLGDGALLSDLQAKLDAANASLAKANTDKSELSKETTGVSSQVDELQASNTELKKELSDAKAGVPTVTTAQPAVSPMALAGVIMGMMRGGGMQGQQRLFLLQTRLKLTPEQNARIKAAMDADSKARGDFMRQMFRNGGKPDPNAPATATNYNTLDTTLHDVLTPAQYTQYQQVQSDEKAARAETQATIQINQMAPLMQFSDSQKEQVLNTLYSVQSAAPDPSSLIGNPNAMTMLTGQVQTTQAALAKVLTPDQMTLYTQANAQGGGFGGFGGGGGGGGGRVPRNGGNGGGTAATATATGGTTTSGYVAPPMPGSTPAYTTTITQQVVNTPAGQAVTGGSTATTDSSTNGAPTTTTGSSTNSATSTTASGTSTNAAPAVTQ